MQSALDALHVGTSMALTQEAALGEAAAARAPLPIQDGFSLGCDHLACSSGLLGWSAAGPCPKIQCCSQCGEARYCSQGCQRAEWRGGGHKAFCSLLRPPPRPLRLLQRLVPGERMAPLLPLDWLDGLASHSEAALADGMTVELSWKGAEKKAGALGALLARLAPRRLILAAPHCWAHRGSGSGETRCPDVTLFEYDTSPALSAEALLASCYQTMPYLFREEDRLAKGVRYEPATGSPTLGRPCPPRMAMMAGALVNDRSIVIREGFMSGLGGLGVVCLGHPRYRWETMGPFQCGEMALEDIGIGSLDFFHPPAWPEAWYVVAMRYMA